MKSCQKFMKMGPEIYTISNFAMIFGLSLFCSLVSSLPLPGPEASPSPQLQFPGQSSYSSQQFTMYKPIQLGYQSQPGGVRQTQDFNGNPINPIFHYNYNVSHPPRPFGGHAGQGQQLSQQLGPQGLIRGPGQASSGVVLSPQQVQYLRQEQEQLRRGGQLQLQQGQPLQSQYQRQYQQNQNYAPVIIANPEVIARPNYQQISQNAVTSSGQGNSAQFFVNEYTEPEVEGIGFRLNSNDRRTGKSRTSGGTGSGSNIVFDPRIPGPNAFQFPDNIIFSGQNQQLPTQGQRYGEQGQRYGQQGQRYGQIQPQGFRTPYNSYNPTGTTTPPPIQIPYITTPSALKKLQQLQRNSQQAVSGFRSSLGLINPASLQSTNLAELSRNSALNLSPAIRSARVQNIVVPVTSAGQTPAGTRLLQNNLNSLQDLQNAITRSVHAHQTSRVGFLPDQGQINTGVDLSSPNLHILKGLAITPENQRDVGHIIFSDPQNPTLPLGAGQGAVLASTAQKVFILPQGSSLSSTDSENSINFNDETPAEIVVSVVDEDSGPLDSISSNNPAKAGGERGKVLSNFSLFLLPSSYKKCIEGYKRAHDGKCRLIIKLRGRSKVYSGSG